MSRRRPPRAAERQEQQETEEARQAREAAEARENDEQDEGDEGDEESDHEAGDAPDDDAEADLAAVSNVDHDAQDGPQEVYRDPETGDGLAVGTALTPAQQAGIDPVDVARHVEQASDRRNLTNMQTDHERENVLDPVSGTANPGITSDTKHSAPGKAGRSDMSGRGPLPDPLSSTGRQVKAAIQKLTEASREAQAKKKRGHAWLNLKELGVSKAVMDALVEGGHVKTDKRHGATFNPETGTVYQIANHKEPDLPKKEDAA